jgi:hypothetical protein
MAKGAITPKDAPEVGVIALKMQNRVSRIIFFNKTGINMGNKNIEEQTIYFGAKGREDAGV